MKSRKKQIVFLICAAVLVVGVVAFLIIANPGDLFPGTYTENERDNLIVYGGKKYEYNEHLSNYLFVGIDTREKVETYETQEDAGQADAIYLVSYNRVENTVQCLSIPRDTMATIHVYSPDGTDLGYSENHINLQYAFGDGKRESCQLMKTAVSTMLYDLPIQGYCSVNMDGIPIAVEVLGGVDLVVPDDSLEAVNPEFGQGEAVTITKANAEQFVRYRNTEITHSAITRTNRQKVFLKAFAEKAKEKAGQESELIVNMYESLKPYMVTNINNDVFAKLLQAKYDSKAGMLDVPGETVAGANFDEFHIDETQLYELILNMFYKEVQDD